ncbi:MAG: hypothetical protein ACR2QO_14125 [Acidimicrobiales bacterium]
MALGITLGVTAAACGSPAADEASPSTLPFVEVAQTAVDPTSTTQAPREQTTSEVAAPEFTVDVFESMLATESGRALLVSSIASEGDLEPNEAECLLDAMPREMLVEAAGSWLGGDGDTALFSDEQLAEVLPILESCGIHAESPDEATPSS